MPHHDRYMVGSHTFLVLLNQFKTARIVLDETCPLDDTEYLNALKSLQTALPYIQAVGYISEYGENYRSNVMYDPKDHWKNDQNVILTIKAYEEGILDVDEDTYQTAIALRDGIPHPIDPKAVATAKKLEKAKRAGFVYLLKSISGHYKIGRTVDPDNRAKTFGVKLPFEVEFVCLIKTDDYEALELDLHTMFKDFRVNGEWFNLAPDDVEYIKSLAVQS